MTSGIQSQDLSELGDSSSMRNRCPGDGVVFGQWNKEKWQNVAH